MKLLAFSTIVVLLSFQIPNVPLEKIAIPDTESDTTDVLSEVLAINADPANKLSSSFRQGHVSDFPFTDYFTQTEYGYKIKLPATNNVPTPTWNDNKIYVSGGFGSKQFLSFHAETGELNWGINLDDDGPSSCVIEDGVVVFNTESCTIFACDVNTGKHLWSWWLGDPLMSTPTVANGIVYSSYPCNTNYTYNVDGEYLDQQNISSNNVKVTSQNTGNYSHAIIAMELKTGKILWQKRIEGDILSAPIEEEGKLHVVTFAGVYYILDAVTGEFTSAKKCRATSAPVLHNGRAYYSQRGDKAGEAVSELVTGYNYELNAVDFSTEKKQAAYLDKSVQSSSKLKMESNSSDAGNGFGGGAPASSNWMAANENIGQSNVSSLQNFYGSRVTATADVQFNMMGDTLFCMDNITGKEKWKYAVSGNLKQEGGYLATAPIVAGKYIITGTLQGEIILMNQLTGAAEKKYYVNEPIRSQPIAMNGWIYVTTTAGNLCAINTFDVTISGWPMLGADNKHSNKIL
ncbi:MAG: PQQ-binding-like beta-propeller repeat protein [Bacteroidetes bacterium]|nr:PQQ-binding-like beta-propeller repeat protein [Bacteroidota bacterium]